MGYYSEIISAAIKLVLTLCSAAVTVVVVPWLKSTVIPWLKERRYYDAVSKFVHAAEKMAESGLIDKEAKKSWVIKMLRAKGYTVNDEMSAMIESAVAELDLVAMELTDAFNVEAAYDAYDDEANADNSIECAQKE